MYLFEADKYDARFFEGSNSDPGFTLPYLNAFSLGPSVDKMSEEICLSTDYHQGQYVVHVTPDHPDTLDTILDTPLHLLNYI